MTAELEKQPFDASEEDDVILETETSEPVIYENDGMLEFTVGEDGVRADKYLATVLPQFSRVRIQALLAEGAVKVNDSAHYKGAQKLKTGEKVTVVAPQTKPALPKAQKIPLNVLYEDDDIIVLDKQAGLIVHPAVGAQDGTMVNALLYHCGESLSGIGGVSRPGIVHRLDKDTSGVIVAAKNDVAHRGLSEQFAAKTAKRSYVALVWGALRQNHGTITGAIGRSSFDRKKMAVVKKGGKPAVTHWAVHQRFRTAKLFYATLLECELETGRTHQIRVHFAENGHALVGDPLYGGNQRGLRRALPGELAGILSDFPRQALHARRLKLVHPRTGRKMAFEAELPEDFVNLLNDIDAFTPEEAEEEEELDFDEAPEAD